VVAGYWYSNFFGLGLYADLWSSSANPSGSSGAFNLELDSGSVNPSISSSRGYGFVVRCMTTSDTSSTPTVTFDGVAAEVESCTNTEIVVTTPPHPAGLVDVAVNNGLTTATYPALWTDTGTNTSTDNSIANIASGYLYQDIYLTLSANKNNITMGGLPGILYTDSLIATVTTNNPDGYNLTIESSQPNLKCTIGASDYYINALSTTPGSMVDNRWGYGTGSTLPAAWTGVTSSPSSPLSSSTSATPESGTPTTVWFGTKFNHAQPACSSYTTTVLLTAVGE
jgi:hypothetical protein